MRRTFLAIGSLGLLVGLVGCGTPSADIATCKDVASALVALRVAIGANDIDQGNAAVDLISKAGKDSTTELGSEISNSINEFLLAAESGSVPDGMLPVSQTVISTCSALGVQLQF